MVAIIFVALMLAIGTVMNIRDAVLDRSMTAGWATVRIIGALILTAAWALALDSRGFW